MILLHRLVTKDFKHLTDVALSFPERATILIEGHNEAGKSSLFEAVYFALYGGSLTGVNQGDLKRYGAEKMVVELAFSINGRPFVIERTVRQNQKVRLVCPTPDGSQEVITSTTEANRRIQGELAFSASALLNTCFVEQKRLDKLESLDARERRETINELLNIEVLNLLEKEFKVSREDQEAIHLARQRVQIAKMDTELPQLRQEEQATFRCMVYRQIQACREQSQAIEATILRAENEKQAITECLEKISEALRLGEHFQAQINAIRNDLPLRNEAWQRAIRTYEEAKEEENSLLTLQAGLPQRKNELADYKRLAEELRQLEDLETMAAQLVSDLHAQQQRLQAYDALLAEWQDGEAEAEVLEARKVQREQARSEAHAAWEARERAVQRDGRLSLLRQYADSHAYAERDAQAISEDLRQAQAHSEALDSERALLKQLEEIGRRLDQQQKDTERLGQVKENLRAAQRRQQEQDTALEEVEKNEVALISLEQEISQSRKQEQEALLTWQTAKQRAALQDWAEAEERCKESDPHAGKLAELDRRRTQAAERLKAATAQATEAGRPLVTGLVLAGGGMVLIAVAFATALLVPLLFLGIVLLGTGSGIGMKARQAVARAREEQTKAQSACHKLDGERAALEGLLKTQEGQRERWHAEEEARRKALDSLNLAIPASPEEARKQIAELAFISVADAQQAYEEAKRSLDKLNNRRELLRGQIDAEQARLSRQNLSELKEAIEKLQAEETRLSQALKEAAADIPQTLGLLGIDTEPEAIQASLSQARHRVGDYEADAKRISSLQAQEQKNQGLVQQTADQACGIAIELHLEGEDIDVWRIKAMQEHQDLENARQETTDTTIRSRWQAADEALKETREQIAVLLSRQSEHRQELDLIDRVDLARQASEIEEAIRANTTASQSLVSVRPTLREAGLPENTSDLQTRLSLLANYLVEDEKRVSQLPKVQEKVNKTEKEMERKAQDLKQSWEKHLPGYVIPGEPSEVAVRLAEVEVETAAELETLNISGLNQEQQELKQKEREIDQQNAARRHEQNRQQDEKKRLLQELGSDEENAATLLQRFPELQRTKRFTVEEWKAEHERRREKVLRLRTERNTQAGMLGLDEMPLDLDAEKQASGEVQKAVDVKRRAGQIVQTTRQTIVDRIMPLTLQNVRLLLPVLTMDRYKDLEWHGDADSLLIYDSRAGSYQRKRVFSGGAKDQISLALRLGFALATLPTGKTARPYWLFLDEPLSSFDRQRTQALVDLLTKGIVRRHFSQIFLISHSESFDPGFFDYRLRLENGVIAENTLPQPT